MCHPNAGHISTGSPSRQQTFQMDLRPKGMQHLLSMGFQHPLFQPPAEAIKRCEPELR